MPIVADAAVRIGADLSQFNAQLRGAGTQVDTLGTRMKRALSPTSLLAAAGGIYAVKKAFDFTIGSAISWESEFAGVRKTVDGTDAELAALEGTLLDMHRTMPVARDDLAAIAEAAGALGIKTEDIAEFTEVVAMIGETTNVSSAQASNALGKLANVLGLVAADFDNFGAALVDLGNKGASTEQEILGIAETAGAGAALIGFAADETLGWSAAVANLGIEAQAGGSSLQRFFLLAVEHVSKAGTELSTMAKVAGTSAAEFARAFDQDASSALQRFIAGLGELTQAEQIATLELLGLSDVRITRTLLGLAGNTENLANALDVASVAWEENTALTIEYGKRADTTAARIEVLGDRFGDLGRQIGDANEGPVNEFLGSMDRLLTNTEKEMELLGTVSSIAAFHFGEMGDAANALAAELGVNHREIANQAAVYMGKTGASYEEAIDAIRRFGLANTAEVANSNRSWQAYEEAAGKSIGHVTTAAEEGSAAVVETLAGTPELAADAMLANQFHLTDATTELVNFMEQAIDPAQEMMNIQGFLASTELAEGLGSPIEAVRRKSEELRAAALGRLAELNAYPWGYQVGDTLARGMWDSMHLISNAAYEMANRVARAPRVESEPDDPNSPLRGITKWGGNYVKTITAGIYGELGRATAASHALSAALVPPLLAPAFSGPEVTGGIGSAGGLSVGDININAPTTPMTPRDIGRELRRTGVFGND